MNHPLLPSHRPWYWSPPVRGITPQRASQWPRRAGKALDQAGKALRTVAVAGLGVVAAVALLSWSIVPEQLDRPSTDQVPTKSEQPVFQWPVEPSRPVLVKDDLEQPIPLIATLPALPDPRADLLAAAGAKIRQWEGVRRMVYTDPSGNKAVGIGCNLDTSSAPTLLKGVGANYSRVRGGLDRLSTRQVEKLFKTQLDLALDVVEHALPSDVSLYSLPVQVQVLLLDLSFNCGKAGYGRFRSVSRAATSGRYDRLPSLLKATRWYRQTGVRAKDHIEALKEVIK